ncbi:MAG: hypothetical protein IDH49_09345 [Gammaproteobacteria bacterium]|nr:hypothetical protein [Gammaproteobacteria bacterium]
MESLVINPTATAQWQALVMEAQAAAGCRLDEDMESYLVFLLMRFAGEPGAVKRILALDYLRAMDQAGRIRQEGLREVGDVCLIHAGLFPLQAQRRRVAISYFVDLGRSAYWQLAGYLQGGSSGVYAHLAHDFVRLMDILQIMRTMSGQPFPLGLTHAYELWNDTGSTRAYAELSAATDALPVKVARHDKSTPSH